LKKKQKTNKKHLDSQHRTAKLTEQVTPGDAKQRAGSPPQKQKLDFVAKPVSGGS